MSFMFNPYPYVDPNAINFPEFPAETTKSALRGNIKIGALLADTKGILVIDGYVGASFPELLVRIEEANADVKFFNVAEAYKSSEELEEMLAESLPTDRVIDTTSLYTFILYTFDGVDPDNDVLTVYLDVYYGEDVDYTADPLGTLRLYHCDFPREAVKLSRRERKALESYS